MTRRSPGRRGRAGTDARMSASSTARARSVGGAKCAGLGRPTRPAGRQPMASQSGLAAWWRTADGGRHEKEQELQCRGGSGTAGDVEGGGLGSRGGGKREANGWMGKLGGEGTDQGRARATVALERSLGLAARAARSAAARSWSLHMF